MLQRKPILAIILMVAVLMTAACKVKQEEILMENGYDKNLSRISSYDTLNMADYQYVDYHKLALNYDELVFDFTAEGKFLPLIWKDKTNESFGLPAYVGDDRMYQDGAQEAVTCIAAVLSATLNGVDKSKDDGHNYVQMLNAFYSEEEKIILNNPSGTSETTSMWYLLYPAILYTQVSSYYPEETMMEENVMSTMNSWYNAYEIMYQEDTKPSFDYTGFDFMTKTPYKNDIWTEPDCAVGIAWMMNRAYELTGEEKYLTAMINCMDQNEQYFGSPLYEILQYFGPVLNAKLNATQGTSYDINQSFGRVFDGTSIPRGGWGSIYGTWGDYDVSGLFGSVTDRGGYAFAMNSFAAAGAIIPTAKYDTRYAKAIGEWTLRLTQNANNFFASETKEENQSTYYLEQKDLISESIRNTLPYEGIIHSYHGKTPWFGGDPTINGWAETDFSLYSGAHIGILAARIASTNQEGILRISLAEQGMEEKLPFYLIYNPYTLDKEVKYDKSSEGTVDLYNTVNNQYLVKDVKGETTLTVPAGEALVIAEIPAGTKLISKNGAIYAEDQFISSNLCSIKVANLKQNQTVSESFDLTIELFSNNDDEIEEAILTIGEDELSFTDTVKINTKNYSTGSKNLTINIKTKKGCTDQIKLRLYFE